MSQWSQNETTAFENHVVNLLDEQGVGHLQCPVCMTRDHVLSEYPVGVPDEGAVPAVAVGPQRARCYRITCRHCGNSRLFDEAVVLDPQ